MQALSFLVCGFPVIGDFVYGIIVNTKKSIPPYNFVAVNSIVEDTTRESKIAEVIVGETGRY